jgi:hypothetical protein
MIVNFADSAQWKVEQRIVIKVGVLTRPLFVYKISEEKDRLFLLLTFNTDISCIH